MTGVERRMAAVLPLLAALSIALLAAGRRLTKTKD